MSDSKSSDSSLFLLQLIAEAFAELLDAARNGVDATKVESFLIKYQGQLQAFRERSDAFYRQQAVFECELRKAAHELVPSDSLQKLVFGRLRPWFIAWEPNWAKAVFYKTKDGQCIGFVTGPMYGTVPFPAELLDPLELEFIFLGARLAGEIDDETRMLQIKNVEHQVQFLPDRTWLDVEDVSWTVKDLHGQRILLQALNRKDAGKSFLEREGNKDELRRTMTDVLYFPLHLNDNTVVPLRDMLLS